MQGGPVTVRAGRGAFSPLALVALVRLAACAPSPPLACATPAGGGCPSLDGVTSFCSWAEWGCAPEPACGGYFVLMVEGVDARFVHYYSAATGEFVATLQEPPGGGSAICLAGPPAFAAPTGCAVDTVAECGPPPRDGVSPPADAGTDAPFNPPSPSGSPSTQPLALPPRFPPYPPR